MNIYRNTVAAIFWTTLLSSSWAQSKQGAEKYVKDLLDANPELFAYTEGKLGVSETGALQYEIPIACVPGRAGMTPQLSFLYDSNAGTGIMGKGWSVTGFSSITRTSQCLAIDGTNGRVAFDNADRLALDGQRLVSEDSSKAYWASGAQQRATYLTEVNTFKRIEAFFQGAEVQRFEVRTKEGLVYFYGARDGNSTGQYLRETTGANPRIIAWPLVRIEDLNGNQIDYEYDAPALARHFVQPLRIAYTGHRNNRQYFANITFGYHVDGFDALARRPVEKYINGEKFIFDQYLRSVDCQYIGAGAPADGNILRSYRIAYESDPIDSSVVTVKSISERFDKDSLTTRFDWLYSDAVATFIGPAARYDAGVKLPEDYSVMLGDFNGDGLPDQVAIGITEDSVHVFFRRNKKGAFGPGEGHHYGFAGPKESRILLGDADANGTADITFCWVRNGRWFVQSLFTQRTLTGTAILPPKEGTLASMKLDGDAEPDKVTFNTSDLNRDGRSDLYAYFVGQERLKFAYSLSGSGGQALFGTTLRSLPLTYQSPTGQLKVPASAPPSLSDLDGNGIADVLFSWSDSAEWHTLVYLLDNTLSPGGGTATVFADSGIERSGASSEIQYAELGLERVSLNTDTGIIHIDSITVNNKHEQLIKDNSLPGPRSVYPMDLNGDGNTDLLITDQGPNGWRTWVLIGRGNGRFEGKPLRSDIDTVPYATNGAVAFGDLNGDGNVDICSSRSGVHGWTARIGYGDGRGGFSGRGSDVIALSSERLGYAISQPTKAMVPVAPWIKANAEVCRKNIEIQAGRKAVPDSIVGNTFNYIAYMADLIWRDKPIPTAIAGRTTKEYFDDFTWTDKYKEITPVDRNFKRVASIRIIPGGAVGSVARDKNFHLDAECRVVGGEVGDFSKPYPDQMAVTFSDYWQPIVADLNGDGICDLGLTYVHQPPTTVPGAPLNDLDGGWNSLIALAHSHTGAYIVGIDPGNDTGTRIEYTTTVAEGAFDTLNLPIQYPVVPFNAPLHVVRATSTTDGIGGRDTLEYRFWNGIMNVTGRGLLGFQHTQTHALHLGLVQDTWCVLKDSLLALGAMPKALKEGRVNGVRVTQEMMHYEVIHQSLTQSRHCSPIVSENTSFGLDGALLVHVSVSTKYDQHGNLLFSKTTNDDGSSSTLSNEYFDTEDDAVGGEFRKHWILGRLSATTLVKERAPEPAIRRTSRFQYDPNTGQLTSERSLVGTPYAIETRYGYDNYGNVVRECKKPLGDATQDSMITRMEYDATFDSRFLTHRTDPLGYESTYIPDRILGVNKTILDVDGNRTQLHLDDGGWDRLGRFKKTSYPDGTSDEERTYRCHACNVPLARSFTLQKSSMAELPAITFYDALGRQVRTVGFDQDFRRLAQDIRYDEVGRVSARSMPYFDPMPTGAPVPLERIIYDSLGRVLRTVAADGDTTTWTYSGRNTTSTNAIGQRGTTQTDTQGRQVLFIDNAGDTVTYAYDVDGHQAHVLDQSGRTFTTVYHPDLGKPQRVQSANSKYPVVYAFDAWGEVSEVSTGPGGCNRTSLKRDLLGRLTLRVDEVYKHLDRNQSVPNNLVADSVKYTYVSPSDAVHGKGKLRKVEVSGDDRRLNKELTYDALGRPERQRFTMGSWSKANDRITTKAWNSIAPQGTLDLGYAYDAQGRIDKKILPRMLATDQESDLQVQYGYRNNQVCVLRSAGQTVWELLATDPLGMDSAIAMNNGATIVRYMRNLPNTDLQGIQTQHKGHLVQDWRYTHDRLGNVLDRVESVKGGSCPESFTYDALNRIHTMRIASEAPTEFRYDDLGNISYRSDLGYYNYNDALSKLIIDRDLDNHQKNDEGMPGDKDDWEYYADALGNRITKEKEEKVLFTIAYNPSNKPRQFSLHQEDQYRIRTYSYDENGQQQVESSGGSVRFFLGGDYEVEVTTQGSNVVVERRAYIQSPSGPVAISILRSGSATRASLTYLLKDAQGSVTALCGPNGILSVGGKQQLFAYDPWGMRVDPATRHALSGGGFDRGYTGHQQWDFAGLVNMGGRVYDPTVSQFLQVDPVWDLGLPTIGLTAYGYCAQNPLFYTDPTGYFSISVGGFFGGLGRAVGGIFSDPGRAIVRGLIGTPLFGPASIVVSNMPGVSGVIDRNAGTIVTIEMTVVMTGLMALGVPPVAAGFATGFSSSFSQTYLNGGSFGQGLEAGLRSGVISGVSAGVTAGIGDVFTGTGALFDDPMANYVGKAVSHAAFQGAMSEAQGGDFWQGALPALVSSASDIGMLSVQGSDLGSMALRTSMAATLGGTVCVLGGGKFMNGAGTAAMVHLYNFEGHRAAFKYMFGGGDTYTLSKDEFEQLKDDPNAVSLKKICKGGRCVEQVNFSSGDNSQSMGYATFCLDKKGNRIGFTDLYDFNPSTHRTRANEIKTRIGSYIPGTPYEFEYNGCRPLGR